MSDQSPTKIDARHARHYRRKLRPQSRLVHGGTLRSGFEETSEAIFQTSGYTYTRAEEAEAAFATDGQRYVYSRFRNPSVSMFERRMALYEGSENAFATASGMAAVFAAVMAPLKAGDRLVAPRALFGSCTYIVKDLATRYGIESVIVDGTDLEQWRAALAKPTQIVFLETPSNPTMEIIDLKAVCDLAHAAGARVVVDNVFATPVLQKPMQLGADVVIYSATKHIDGQGRCLGGIILCDNAFAEIVHPFLRHTGPALAPFNAWLLLKGLETMEMRVRAQCASAEQVARFLEGHPKIARTLYPGLPSHPQHALAKAQMELGGTMISFEVAGGKAEAFKLMNGLELILISNNLGDSKSLITHPATSTHQRLTDEERARVGIVSGTIRLSIGLEDTRDLIEDLDAALKGV
ncbi:MAG: O-succinylhomoserine sulfhydrylase [Rhodospirillaceae bacterium]